MRFEDLLPGDIVLFKNNGKLFHVAIFSYEEDRASNLIDATSNKGVARSTLEGLYNSLLKFTRAGTYFGLFTNNLEIGIVRSKNLSGEQIVDQAEFWRLHGLTYDVGGLADIMDSTWSPPATHTTEEVNNNIGTYWNCAMRSRSALVENPNPINPGMLSLACTFLLTPIWHLPQACSSFFVDVLRYLNDNKEPAGANKGVNCVGFVLTTLAAVALKDENVFDGEKVKQKLGTIADINPANYSLNDAMTHVFSNEELFEDMGLLDTKLLASRKFDKDLFREEQKYDSIATKNLNYPTMK